jgi:dihydropteroate synthase
MSAIADLAGLKVGAGFPVRIMGVINVSPESFYKASVQNRRSIQKAVRELEEQKADVIDIGAMSTAPYLRTKVSEEEETERLAWAVRSVRSVTRLPLSIDTSRPGPTLAGLKAGADILNDVTGLAGGAAMWSAARNARGLILMAHPSAVGSPASSNPVMTVRRILEDNLERAAAAGADPARIVVDPGIGFFRNSFLEWWQWDLAVLRGLDRLITLPAPLLIGVSRKSFVSQILEGRAPEDRLAGSLGATVAAVLAGAAMVRTHDVAETRDAVRVAQAIQFERISFRSEPDRKERRKRLTGR